MATLATHFDRFHTNILLDEKRVGRIISAHTTLRDRIQRDDQLKKVVREVFLQGSYKQSTAVRPPQDGEYDIDVVLAMDLSDPSSHAPSSPYKPQSVIDWVAARLEKTGAYTGMVERRNRCVRINYRGEFHMDVVPAHAKWGADKILEVPDRGQDGWRRSHPKAYLDWCTKRNDVTSGRFARVVKYLKCWRDDVLPEAARPKSIILQTMIGKAIPERAGSDAEAVAVVLKGLAAATAVQQYFSSKLELPNPAMPEENLGAAWDASSVKLFAQHVDSAALNATAALAEPDASRSVTRWAATLGIRFPRSVQ